MPKIKIAIADDYEVFRDGLKVSLSVDENFEIVLEADNGEDLVKKIEINPVDVILMDMKMPVMDGLKATKIIRGKFPFIKVLIVSMYEDDRFIIHAIKNNAQGYLLKNSEPEEIRKSIYAVCKNGYYFNDTISRALLKKLLLENDLNPSFNQNADLTKQEQEILKLICKDNTTGEISKEIFLKLIEKTGVYNMSGLAMFAIKNGISE